MSDSEFERRVAAALHAPLVEGAEGARVRGRIMDRVRAVPMHERPARHASLASGRTMRHSIVGVALAAGVGSLTTLPAMMSDIHGGAPTGRTGTVIGDTVSATLHDTLRLVRLMFDDTAARQVAAVGDFNDWKPDSTPLRRDVRTRQWMTTVALRDGAHRYAFVVDGTRWAIDPSAPRVRGTDGRVYSLLHVASTTN